MSNKVWLLCQWSLYRVRSMLSAIAASGIVEMETVDFSNDKT